MDFSNIQCSSLLPEVEDLHIEVLGIPEGYSSRVETQIKLNLRLLDRDGVRSNLWHFLRVSENILVESDFKRRINRFYEYEGTFSLLSYEYNVLVLEANVICDSDPYKKVSPCSYCISREIRYKNKADKKRVGRFNSIKFSSLTSLRKAEKELMRFNHSSTEKKAREIILICSKPLIKFDYGEISLPVRITCFCRHKNENLGFSMSNYFCFRVLFSMKNYKGDVVATGISPAIMITHKYRAIDKQGPNNKANQLYENGEQLTTADLLDLEPENSHFMARHQHSNNLTINHFQNSIKAFTDSNYKTVEPYTITNTKNNSTIISPANIKAIQGFVYLDYFNTNTLYSNKLIDAATVVDSSSSFQEYFGRKPKCWYTEAPEEYSNILGLNILPAIEDAGLEPSQILNVECEDESQLYDAFIHSIPDKYVGLDAISNFLEQDVDALLDTHDIPWL
ncbi:hypothetical protein J3Q64DRAFT_1700778 [Phycomyces blakesleeanus]|uniref:SPT23/MGA2-like DNA-binding domain-containing protein n=1 Tax=Phycomyces blakesleeanus TaxID=4837 RepID=A0ABR3AT61_PHYBL